MRKSCGLRNRSEEKGVCGASERIGSNLSPSASANEKQPMKKNQPTHEEIAQRAHEIWSSERQPSGRDDEFWLTAEQQLQTISRILSAPPVRAARAKRAKEKPSSLGKEINSINNNKLEERLSDFSPPTPRSATSL